MILVAGATGNVGSEVVRALAGEPVRALVRDPDAALPDGVEPVTGDLNLPESMTGALAGARAVFLLPGYADMPGLLAEARRAGVEHVVLLSGGSAGNSDMTNAVTRYMAASESAVRESGLSWTFLRPTAFMSNALRWLPQLRSGDQVRVPFPDVRTASIDPSDLGAVAARALLSDEYRGDILWPTGPAAMTPAEQVAVLADVLGRDLEFVGLTNEEARTELLATTPAEYVDAFFDFYVNGSLDESTVRPTVHEVTGRAPPNLRPVGPHPRQGLPLTDTAVAASGRTKTRPTRGRSRTAVRNASSDEGPEGNPAAGLPRAPPRVPIDVVQDGVSTCWSRPSRRRTRPAP